MSLDVSGYFSFVTDILADIYVAPGSGGGTCERCILEREGAVPQGFVRFKPFHPRSETVEIARYKNSALMAGKCGETEENGF